MPELTAGASDCAADQTQRRIAMSVRYRGDAFYGFQRQPGFPSVQEELELAWVCITGEREVVHGSGRTDSGVHAYAQVVHITTLTGFPAEKVRMAMNAYLPPELVVTKAREVSLDFHSRFSTVGKRYLYRLAVGSTRPVLQAGLVAWEKKPLNLKKMREAATHFLGTRDFASMAASGREMDSTVRTIRAFHIYPTRGGLHFVVQGDGCLYRMVRNMVGTLLEVGRGKRAPEWVDAVLSAADRKKAGPTAAPEGLYLLKVLYAKHPFPPVLHSQDSLN